MKTKLIKQLNDSIDVLKAGRSLKVGDFILEMSSNGRIRVDGYIFYNSINDIPKSILKSKLKELKENFTILINEALLFKEFSTRVGLDYYIVLDYQTGGISICAEIEGQFKVFF